MLNISKTLSTLLATAILSTTVFAQSDEFELLPFFNKDWDAKLELAAVAGYMDFNRNSMDNGITHGLEVSFDCPVFKLPGDNTIRQQLSLNTYNKSDVKVQSIEMNPYYMVDISKDLVFGFGPGIGGVKVSPDNSKNQWLFALQAGAGVKYYINDFILGADVRYQWTAEKDLGAGSDAGVDNTRFLVKAGYRF